MTKQGWRNTGINFQEDWLKVEGINSNGDTNLWFRVFRYYRWLAGKCDRPSIRTSPCRRWEWQRCRTSGSRRPRSKRRPWSRLWTENSLFHCCRHGSTWTLSPEWGDHVCRESKTNFDEIKHYILLAHNQIMYFFSLVKFLLLQFSCIFYLRDCSSMT